jgi:serine/threonine protein phosphatase PrpC
MGNRLPGFEGASEKLGLVELTVSDMTIAGCGIQGVRRSMEDEHLILSIPNCEGHILLGVFDGHSGSAASRFVKDNILTCLVQSGPFIKYAQELNARDSNSNGNENGSDVVLLLKEALEETFLSLDKIMQSSELITEEGCTAVVCLITPSHYICANAGDSRCVLGRKSPESTDDQATTSKRVMSIDLSFDHKPELEAERNRIESAGGFVEKDDNCHRVNGFLAVSRAFGDFDLKQNADLSQSQQLVTCFPEITTTIRQSEDDFIIMGCDGLWDITSSDDCAAKVRDVVGHYGETSMKLVVEEVLDWALERNSADNVTVVIARLPGAKIGDKSIRGGALKAKVDREQARPYQYDMYDNIPTQDATPQFGSVFYGLDDESGPPEKYDVAFD